MIRNLKAVGLLAFAALAMSAMFASMASAEGTEPKGVLTAGATPNTHKPATIVGEQYPDPFAEAASHHKTTTIEEWEEWNFFAPSVAAAEAGEELVQCDTATLTGTNADGTAKEIKVKADYTHCLADGQPATVTMNGCEYLLTQPTTFKGGGGKDGEYTGKTDLTCPITPGEPKVHDKVIIHVYGFGNSTNTSHFFNVCTIEVYPNEPSTVGEHTVDPLGGHIIYDTTEEANKKDDVTAKVEVTGIASNSNCPGGETHKDGVYTSTVTVTAFDDINDAPNPTEHKEQFDLWISEEE